jgi:hypothetical protein
MDVRQRYFRREWKTVTVELPQPGGYFPVEVSVDKLSFWTPNCGELIHKDIGQWIQKDGAWPPWKPWKYEVEAVGDRHFRVIRRI